MTTKEQILKCFKDIDHAYNDCTRYDTLKCMLDELQEPCDKCVYSTSEGCQYDDITETIPPFDDAISRQAVLKIIDGWYDNNRDTENIEDLIVLITYMCSVNPQKQKSEWQQDHEILKAYSDGANEVLESIKYLIEQYEHYLELLDADMKDGSATIVTKTKYAVYAEVVKQLKEVLESEDKT